MLSELGGYLLSPDKAPAGTKRISHWLRSSKWGYQLIEQFLWQRAAEKIDELEADDKVALAIWDESVVEKPESIALEGLCAVRSSTAQHLKRIKPGYYNSPGGRPVFVPGLNWVTVMVMGLKGLPSIASMRWWSSRGKFASDRRAEEELLLEQCGQAWARRVLHI